METKYRIIARTNPYIAQRDMRIFKGKTLVTLEENLTLDQAKFELDNMAQNYYESEGGYDWGFHGGDGMRFEWDSRYFSIEEMPVVTFSIETYKSNAEIRIDSSDEREDWVNVTISSDEIDREESTEQNLKDIKLFDIDPVIPSGHIVDIDSLNSMMKSLETWIDPNCK